MRLLDRVRPEREYLPRSGPAGDLGRTLAAAFADELGLELVWVTFETEAEIVDALLSGKGDLALGRVTASGEPTSDAVALTIPFRRVRGQLVSRADDGDVSDAGDLAGRRIAIQESSPFVQAVEDFRAGFPGIDIEQIPEDVHPDEILHRVAAGAYDVTIAESFWTDKVLGYRNDLRVAFDLEGAVSHTAAVRPDATDLLRAANEFLLRALPQAGRPAVYHADLDEMRSRGALRMLTLNGPATYYTARGELVGFEYDLMGKLADELGLRLDVVVVPSADDLIPWLRDGRGDVIAAGVTPRDEPPLEDVAYSRPYHMVNLTVVQRDDEPELDGPPDLAGRDVALRRDSPFWPVMEAMRDSTAELNLVSVAEPVEAADLIAGVGTGDYDLAVEESHLVDMELAWREDVRVSLRLDDEAGHRWIVRQDQPALLDAVDAFLEREYRGLFYNIVRRRYFGGTRRAATEPRAGEDIGVSPYDDLVRTYADRYDLLWRLVVAQMYQESRFDPEARSSAGAVGLMQVLPRTAAEFGFDDLTDPEQGIHAGLRYLVWVRDRFEADLEFADRLAFTLAGYNAGYGHVMDARRVAERRGWDPNRWFDNVERAMLLLSQTQVASTVRFGYCRGSEPVRYVRAIVDRVGAYLRTP